MSERQLFATVYRRMRALAGSNAPDLDDMVQLAAEQVFKSLDGFDGRSDLTTWIYSICYRVLLRQRRWYQRWRLRFTSDEGQDLPAEGEEASARLEARERARQLHGALAKLSDKYRAVVVLHDLEGMSVHDIARIVGAGELTVRSRLRDGRKRLKNVLLQAAEDYGGPRELEPS